MSSWNKKTRTGRHCAGVALKCDEPRTPCATANQPNHHADCRRERTHVRSVAHAHSRHIEPWDGERVPPIDAREQERALVRLELADDLGDVHLEKGAVHALIAILCHDRGKIRRGKLGRDAPLRLICTRASGKTSERLVKPWPRTNRGPTDRL